jgi:hypothetical protein
VWHRIICIACFCCFWGLGGLACAARRVVCLANTFAWHGWGVASQLTVGLSAWVCVIVADQSHIGSTQPQQDSQDCRSQEHGSHQRHVAPGCCTCGGNHLASFLHITLRLFCFVDVHWFPPPARCAAPREVCGVLIVIRICSPSTNPFSLPRPHLSHCVLCAAAAVVVCFVPHHCRSSQSHLIRVQLSQTGPRWRGRDLGKLHLLVMTV